MASGSMYVLCFLVAFHIMACNSQQFFDCKIVPGNNCRCESDRGYIDLSPLASHDPAKPWYVSNSDYIFYEKYNIKLSARYPDKCFNNSFKESWFDIFWNSLMCYNTHYIMLRYKHPCQHLIRAS